MSDNQRKAELSKAFIAALAARAGYALQPGPDPDTDSVDVTIRSGPPNRYAIDIQLKATARPEESHDGLHFRLKRKNYNDLVDPSRSVPLLLLVLELPVDESRWLECSPDRMIMRKCGWWFSLVGENPIDAESKTVIIPHTQRIGESGLAPLFAHAR